MKPKYAYITGTSRGLGKAMAELLLEEGWWVKGIARHCSIAHDHYEHFEADLSNPWQQWLPEIFRQHETDSKLLLVNNAASLGEVGYVGTLSPDAVVKTVALNVTAPALLQNEFLKLFPQQEKLVLNISSGAAQYPVDGWSIYCSSKAALDMLSEVAAHEAELNKKNNLRVFSVAPGVVDTSMQEHIRQTDKSAFSRIAYFLELKKEKRLARPEDVVRQLLMLVEHPQEFKGVKQDVRKL